MENYYFSIKVGFSSETGEKTIRLSIDNPLFSNIAFREGGRYHQFIDIPYSVWKNAIDKMNQEQQKKED